MPILLDKDIAYNNYYKTMGFGVLKETKKCLVTEERNGAFTLALTYSSTGKLRDKITRDKFIVASAPFHYRRQEYQIFRITKIMKSTDGNIEIEGEHISYLLEDMPFFPPILTFDNVRAKDAMAILGESSIVDNDFIFKAYGFDTRNSFSFDLSKNPSIRKALGGSEGSLLTHFNGEYLCGNYRVYLLKNRAEDKGRALVYGRDVISAEFEDDVSSMYNAILPFAKAEDGSFITLTEKWLASENYDFETRLIVKSVEFEGVKNTDELRKKAKQYIKANNIGFPNLYIKVKLRDLKNAPDFKLEESIYSPPELCEPVTVFVPDLGVNLKTKIIEVVWDSLRDEVESISLGTIKKGLSDVFNNANNVSLGEIERVRTDLEAKVDKYVVDKATGKRYEWRLVPQDGVARIELVEV